MRTVTQMQNRRAGCFQHQVHPLRAAIEPRSPAICGVLLQAFHALFWNISYPWTRAGRYDFDSGTPLLRA